MKITIIAGARPNFIKIAPIIHAIDARKDGILTYRLVHTGQHYDKRMSEAFFIDLNIPFPDANLECGGGSQAQQTAAIMVAFEQELMNNPTDLVLVVGDVTSTMACTLVAKKMSTKVAHVEGGIRSFDQTMPEEINRLVTDSISDFFFTTSSFANDNLLRMGVKEDSIYFVGNVMIDTLYKNISRLRRPYIFDKIGLSEGKYFVLTMHRPSNVDEALQVESLIRAITESVDQCPVVFPIHPRTAKMFTKLNARFDNLHIVDPLGYLEFNYLVKHSKGVITDSGGVTEETTVMGIPCITLRENTERPETIDVGTNELVGSNITLLRESIKKILDNNWKKGAIPELWDGKSSERIVDVLQTMDSL